MKWVDQVTDAPEGVGSGCKTRLFQKLFQGLVAALDVADYKVAHGVPVEDCDGKYSIGWPAGRDSPRCKPFVPGCASAPYEAVPTERPEQAS